jgi:hypothetical protein
LVSLKLKSIRPASDAHIAVTYDITSGVQIFEFEVLMPIQADINAVEVLARSRLDQFAKDLSSACQTNPLIQQVASAKTRPHP